MHSRIYKGWVEHGRYAPRAHRFRYRLFMLYLDLAEIDRVFDGVPGWSAKRPALAWFNRKDFLAPFDLPLDEAVRALVAEKTGRRPEGPIRLLTHLRYFGYSMNPVSVYYCFDRSDSKLEFIVAEITNTPWRERHQYVLECAAASLASFEFDKAFHVSPFMPMEQRYRWRIGLPGETLAVHMQNFGEQRLIFEANLALRAEALSRTTLLKALIAYPLMSIKVIAAIYWQALMLRLKRVPVHPHPDKKPDRTMTCNRI